MNFEQIISVLSKKSVGIAGCGGLGSNCAVALARVGIGKLVICDFDIVVESNLNRQYFFYSQIDMKKSFALKENIKNINPFIVVEAHDIKLEHNNIPSFFQHCDVIVEAFDRADMKQMIIETVLDEMPETPLVCGIGLAGWGNSNAIKMKQTGNLYVCGDGDSEVTEDSPPLAPRVGIVANMQANTVIEILLNESK
ncbi:MAG: sulfur carrier protein ThiS adenylyltransferase ThiF [Bacteroidales bacterium]|jgi:sulfur carrier protein ThiS adenylyltransferase|nr:sulfur carrier protein ThiS adenylyltransferase ThiF [Bacteroidales bacterium]MDD4214676.1 sulfur carrier protein ThiS adenylyltransferase ThiF [Bacteroidales bacterium]